MKPGYFFPKGSLWRKAGQGKFGEKCNEEGALKQTLSVKVVLKLKLSLVKPTPSPNFAKDLNMIFTRRLNF